MLFQGTGRPPSKERQASCGIYTCICMFTGVLFRSLELGFNLAELHLWLKSSTSCLQIEAPRHFKKRIVPTCTKPLVIMIVLQLLPL